MKVFTWLALLAMVHATHGEASHEDHEERKLAHAEKQMAEMGAHMGRHLRRQHAKKAPPNLMRRAHKRDQGKKEAEEMPSEAKHAVHADEIRRVADGLSEKSRKRMDLKGSPAKLGNHKLSMGEKRNAKERREPSAADAHAAKNDSVRKAAKQMSRQKLDRPTAGRKFAKNIPDVKKATHQAEAAALVPKKMNAKHLRDTQHKFAQSVKEKFKNTEEVTAKDGEE